MLYFAYGSNLDSAQMRRRCPSARAVGAAVLNDHALCFTGFSQSWGGAVASVVKRTGWKTPGLIYWLSPDDLDALDMFEGHPVVYQRVTRIVVRREDGKRARVQTYVHNNNHGIGPGPKYLQVIERAYRRLGFDSQPLTVAAWGLT